MRLPFLISPLLVFSIITSMGLESQFSSSTALLCCRRFFCHAARFPIVPHRQGPPAAAAPGLCPRDFPLTWCGLLQVECGPFLTAETDFASKTE